MPDRAAGRDRLGRGHDRVRVDAVVAIEVAYFAGLAEVLPVSGVLNLFRSSAEIREILGRATDRPETEVASFMHTVVTGPTDHDTVTDIVRTADLHMFNVMRLCAFAKLMQGLVGSAKTSNRCAARGAEVFLTR
jgi:hypothetical protein